MAMVADNMEALAMVAEVMVAGLAVTSEGTIPEAMLADMVE